MDKELKTKWVEALRSGKYQQAQKTLRNADGAYCCLGVLCDVVDPEAWNGDQSWQRKQDEYACHNDLSSTFARSIGLPASTEGRLITMNDEEGKDFAAIAEFIEEFV